MERLRNPMTATASSAIGWEDTSGHTVDFLGCRFDKSSFQEATRDILSSMHGPFKYVVTPNVHHIVGLLDDPSTMGPLYERAWRVYCDSRVLSRLARLSGLRLPVITGSDLTADLILRAADQSLTVAVIGPTSEACARLQEKYPDLKIVLHTPPMGFIKSEAEVQKCIDFVVKTHAPLVFLAVGRPQQEILASKIADHPEARGIGLCIGASIDFLTGEQQRAPEWLQRAGLEWLHRLFSDPRRLARRYLIESPRIFFFVCREWTKSSGHGRREREASAQPRAELGLRRLLAIARREIPRRSGPGLAALPGAKPGNLP